MSDTVERSECKEVSCLAQSFTANFTLRIHLNHSANTLIVLFGASVVALLGLCISVSKRHSETGVHALGSTQRCLRYMTQLFQEMCLCQQSVIHPLLLHFAASIARRAPTVSAAALLRFVGAELPVSCQEMTLTAYFLLCRCSECF